ncbi:hypothetical protein Tco_0330855 [Tanacetum coccineum]
MLWEISIIPAYKPISKFLMNCPLRTAFTKCPLVLYQNFLREFWCTTIAYHPNPSFNEDKPRPLKEFLINFTVMNRKKPLTLDFNTFTTSTSLDYNNGAYVAHPFLEAVKAELAKIVLGGNYSSTKQVNFIQQFITYSLITATKIDIGEIIYSDLDSVSPLPLSTKKKKKKTQTVTPTLPKSQGPKASGALSKKRKEPKPEKTPSETKGFPFTASHEGTTKTTPCPEGSLGHKDSGGNKPPADMEPINLTVADLSGTGAKYRVDETQSARLRYRSLTENKGETSSEVDPNTQTLQLNTFAVIQEFLLSEDELAQ